MPEPETEFHKGERPIKSGILIKTPDVNMNYFQDENFGRRTVRRTSLATWLQSKL
jgi:hypothetical protein